MTDSLSDKTTDTTDSLSVTEAAARLGVSERTIWRRIKQGKLETHKTTDGVRVSLSVAPVSPAKVSDSSPVSDSKVTDTATDTLSVPSTPEVLKALEMIDRLQQQNQELTAAAAHWQARAQDQERRAIHAEEQVKLLMAPKDEPAEAPEQPAEKRSWWQRLWR